MFVWFPFSCTGHLLSLSPLSLQRVCKEMSSCSMGPTGHWPLSKALVVWRCATTTPTTLCVIIAGTSWMPVWCAHSWGRTRQVTTIGDNSVVFDTCYKSFLHYLRMMKVDSSIEFLFWVKNRIMPLWLQGLYLWGAVCSAVAPPPFSWTTFAALVASHLFSSAATMGSKCSTVTAVRLLGCSVTVSNDVMCISNWTLHCMYNYWLVIWYSILVRCVHWRRCEATGSRRSLRLHWSVQWSRRSAQGQSGGVRGRQL